MAASHLAKPGEKFGPCETACSHPDCMGTRRMAAIICRICGEPIGFDRNFYQEGAWDKLVHASCLEDEVERQHKINDC